MWIHTLLPVGPLGSFLSAGALTTSHISGWMWVMTPPSLTWLKLDSNSWHTEAPTELNLGQNPEYSSAAEGLVLVSHGEMSTHLLLCVENHSPAAGSKLICCWMFEDNESTHISCVEQPLSMDFQFGVPWLGWPHVNLFLWLFHTLVCGKALVTQ